MFSTPGYAALEQRERRRAAVQLGIRAALNPSLAAERDALLASNSWTARVVRHIQSLPARRGELEAFRRRLLDDDFLAKAIARAQTLLPDGTTERAGTPQVAFIFFLPDGRGYPNLIVADLANLEGRPDIVPFFAHEVTHFYYAHLARERGAQPQTPFDKARLTLLTKLFEESLGDQHDKAPYLDLSEAEFTRAPLQEGRRDYLRDYRAHYATAPWLVVRLQEVIASQDPDRLEAFSRDLALEGRPLGFHMTRVIRLRLGDNRLKSLVGDPLGWYAAFLEASSGGFADFVPAWTPLVTRRIARIARAATLRAGESTCARSLAQSRSLLQSLRLLAKRRLVPRRRNRKRPSSSWRRTGRAQPPRTNGS